MIETPLVPVTRCDFSLFGARSSFIPGSTFLFYCYISSFIYLFVVVVLLFGSWVAAWCQLVHPVK